MKDESRTFANALAYQHEFTLCNANNYFAQSLELQHVKRIADWFQRRASLRHAASTLPRAACGARARACRSAPSARTLRIRQPNLANCRIHAASVSDGAKKSPQNPEHCENPGHMVEIEERERRKFPHFCFSSGENFPKVKVLSPATTI